MPPGPRQGPSSAFGRTRGYGVSVGDFYIDSEIGKGSFAQVYMGVHKESKEIVAVKSVELSKLNKKLKDNLYGEIQILKTLRHPHIVALHDCVENPTHINLIMEYCELGDLSLFIKKREKLSTHPATHDMARKYPANPQAGLHEVVTRHFLKQLASALQFLRSKNYMHRDVKPQNLLLLPSPQYRNSNSVPIMTASVDSMIPVVGLLSLPMLKLADFGFARVLPSTSLADTLCGSPLYMAPEILRYERYDIKADLWSVGTVLHEMCAGRPPFRARNHVELLRKIEANQDIIKFPREAVVSPEMKSLIRALLKRQPTERIGFENFFNHQVVVEPIPGLVEDDVPKPAEKPADRPMEPSLPGNKSLAQLHQEPASSRRRSRQGDELLHEVTSSPTSRSPRSPKMPTSLEARRLSRPSLDGLTRHTYAPAGPPDAAATDGLGIRPKPHSTLTAPARPQGLSDVSSRIPAALQEAVSTSARPSQVLTRRAVEEDKAAQDVADMRDYVMIEKRQVEINAFADELDVNRRQPYGQSPPPSSGPIEIRRNTHQGTTTTAGAGGMSTSPRSQALIGRDHASGSPGSASSIAKAIQDASLRLFGYYKYNNARPSKGPSPPVYSPFPAYPTSTQPVALIGDGRSAAAAAAASSSSLDDESRCVQLVEDLATRSDVVYCFAEIKFKQVFPTTPSVDPALGGALVEDMTSEDDDDLTAEAIVGLSEEAFVLYFKVLTLLAKAMDIANAWWRTKRGLETPQDVVQRVNAVVQWVRTRFNEVLEKTELVQLKLMEGQKRLPDTHPSHPNNHGNESTSSTVSGLVVMTTGITAEKLMYDRALDMSRAAAIREISHNDLPGCEISYLTAIRMLEVVLDSEDDSVRKKVSGVLKDSMEESFEEPTANLDNDDKQAVKKLIQMIRARLMTVHRKMQDIAEAEKSQQALQMISRRRSGDDTQRTMLSHASPP